MQITFKDREQELEQLGALLKRTACQLIVVFGRRRIGKTALLTRWTDQQSNTPTLYWVAHRTTSEVLLRSFSRAYTATHNPGGVEMHFSDWEAALEGLFASSQDRQVIAVIDEFPYLVQSVPALPSLLQKIWDRHQHTSRLVLVLCGSHYHMMQDELFSPKRPLYGRATATLLVEEIAPDKLHLFLPRYSQEQVVETFAVVGGVPKYLEMWDDRVPVLKNVQELILSPVTLFRHEAIFLIQDELTEPRTFLAILEALGAGFKTPKEIASLTGIAMGHVGKYLRTLLDLRIVRRIISGDVVNFENTRLTRYEIRDPFMRFYFQFIHRNPDLIEQNRVDRLMEIIKRNFASFVGTTGYEELARRQIVVLGDRDELPFQPEHVGRAWNRSVEIDVVAVDHAARCVLLGECKWTRSKVGPELLSDLRTRGEKLRRLNGYHKHYALFSKAGFTAPLLREADATAVMLFDGATLERR